MGQDFVARKAAKKQRKRQARDAETGRKKRRRKEDGFEIAGGACGQMPSTKTALLHVKWHDWSELLTEHWVKDCAASTRSAKCQLGSQASPTLLQAKGLLRTTASAYNMSSCVCYPRHVSCVCG